MKSKIEKYLKYAAEAVFVATLAINTVVTLDDPFVLLSDEAIATGTDDSDSGSDSSIFLLQHQRMKNGINPSGSPRGIT